MDTKKLKMQEEKKAIDIAHVEIKKLSQKLPTERERWVCRGAVVKGMLLNFQYTPHRFFCDSVFVDAN